MPHGGSTSRRRSQRSAAFKRAPLGQFTPGRLSQSDARTTTTSAAPSRDSPFVTLDSGRTGTRVSGFEIQQSQAFQKKLAEARAQEAQAQLGLAQNIAGSRENQIITGGTSAANFAAQQGVQVTPGQPPSAAEFNIPSTAELEQPSTPPTATEGGRGGIKGAIDKFFELGKQIEVALGATQVDEQGNTVSFNTEIFGLGGGGFRSLIKIPTRQIAKGTASKLAKQTAPGAINKAVVKGNVKEFNTVKRWWEKIFSKDKLVTYTNPKTGAQTQKIVSTVNTGTLAALGTILAVGYGAVKSGTGTFEIGERDRLEEAGQAVEMNLRDMEDDPIAVAELEALWTDIQNTNTSWLPFGIGASVNAKNYAKWMNERLKIRKEHAIRMSEMADEGKTPEQTADFWSQYHRDVQANETAEANARVDYYNEQRLLTEQQLAQLRADINATERAERRKEMQETADFWLEYKRQLAKLEEEERKRAAAFWLQYRKEIAKIQAESGRSRLNFGLL